MSLASMLLYKNNEAVIENASTTDVDDLAADIKAIVDDEPTTECWVDSALESLVNDIYSVDKAYHTADIIAEVKVIREGADPSVLLEGIVNSGIEKIKNAFKTFWAKLKAWFGEVKRQFKLIFTKGKEFIKEFRTELDKKPVKGFTYTGKEYDLDAGDKEGEKIFDAVEDKVAALTNWKVAEKMTAGDVSKDDYIAFLKGAGIDMGGQGDMSSSDIQDKFIKDGKFAKGSANISELNENLVKMYHKGNDADETAVIDDFANVSKDDMMAHVESYEKAVKEIEKSEKKFDALMNKIIKAYDSISKKDLGGDDAAYKQAQFASRAITALLAVGKVPSSVKQSMYKEAAHQYERVLKSFLRWKPAKESVEVEPQTDSLLEQAMGMIF